MEKIINRVIKYVNTHILLQNGYSGSVGYSGHVNIRVMSGTTGSKGQNLMGITALPGTNVTFSGYFSTAEILNPGIYQNSLTKGIEVRDSQRCCKTGQDPHQNLGILLYS